MEDVILGEIVPTGQIILSSNGGQGIKIDILCACRWRL